MAFKILTLNNISMVGLNRLPRESYEVSSDIARPDAILVRSYKMHDMDIPDSVLAIGRAGAGTNNIPVADLGERGVPVFNAPGANANAVKELVLAGLLLAARNIPEAWDYVRQLDSQGAERAKAVEAGKKQFAGYELPSKTLGVIGLGAIGVEVANAALALGMKVIGYDPQITVQRAWQMSSGVEQAVNLDDLCSRSDMITVHVPLVQDTRGIVNEDRLNLMPKGAVLLNFARDGVVDTDAAVAATESGQLSYYVTDFPIEALKTSRRAICLPHLGASTVEAEDNCAIMVAESVKDYLENGNIHNSVNFPEARLERGRAHRLAIPHKNVPNMVAKILATMENENVNISDMLNASRGDLAYMLLDLDGPVNDEAVARMRAVEGVLDARVLPPGKS